MKHQLQTIREALEFFECGSYSTSKALSALTALSELERMAGNQEPAGYLHPQAMLRLEQGETVAFRKKPYEGEPSFAVYVGATPPAQQPHDRVAVTWDKDRTRILAVTLQDADGRVLCVIDEAPDQQQADSEELAQYKRMFNAACVELGRINEALGLDPDDGGAEPILSAIAEMKQPQAEAEMKRSAYAKLSAAVETATAKQPQAEAVPEMHDALCPALTGGDCTCTPPATIDKAWAQFCSGIGRGPDAPYPGMIEAFESHYGQTFTDKDWREETGVWAAAWKAAKAHGEAAPQQAEAVPSDTLYLLRRLLSNRNFYSHSQLAEEVERIISTAPQQAAAPVAWPTMPPSKGQSPVLFEDGYAEGWAKCLSACKSLFPAQQPQAEAVRDADVEAAAKKMAEIFDYPWDFMPEKGRNTMRENVRAVLAAAQGEKP